MNRSSRKARKRFRAARFARHLARFVDRHRFPDFRLTDAMIECESKRQTYGDTSLTKQELELILPLRDAQRWKEVTIDGLVAEMTEWWAKGWGWAYPIISEIEGIRGDWVMKKALLEIKRRCHERGFSQFLIERGSKHE